MKAYLVWSSLSERRLHDLMWAFHGNGGRFEIYPANAALMSANGRVLGKHPIIDGEGNVNHDVLEFLNLDAWEYRSDAPAGECRRCSEENTKAEGRCHSCGLIWEDDWLRESQDDADA